MSNPIPRTILHGIAHRRTVDSLELGIKASPITDTTDLRNELGHDAINDHTMTENMAHVVAYEQEKHREGGTRAAYTYSETPTYYVALHGTVFAFVTYDGTIWTRKDWEEYLPLTDEETRMSDYLRASLGHAAALQLQDYWTDIAALSY